MNNLLKNKEYSATCTGSGLVVLDVILNGDSNNPKFLAGGSCCNVLTILSYLGWNSIPIARLGKDTECDRIMEDIKKWGVNTKFIEMDSKISTPRIIEKIYSGKNPRHGFSLRCAHGKWLPDRKSFLLESLKQIENKIPPSKVYYFDRATPSSLLLAKQQKEKGALIVFEPPRLLDDKNFKSCIEISNIVKHCYDLKSNNNSLNMNIPLEIQTMGEKGLRYRLNMLGQTKWTEVPSFSVNNLVDAAGSGDWLTAGLIHELGQSGSNWKITDKKLQNALRVGQCLAALNCHFNGARGLMYHISSAQLRKLVRDIITNKASIEKVLRINPTLKRTKTKLSSRCKICLCPTPS